MSTAITYHPEKSLAKTIADLPSLPGVYVLSASEYVLYVGESKNLKSRWKEHNHKNFIGLPGVFLTFELCSNRKERERELISQLKPKLNGGKDPTWIRNSILTGRSPKELRDEYFMSLDDPISICMRDANSSLEKAISLMNGESKKL